MCQDHFGTESRSVTDEDEYLLDTPLVREFIDRVREEISRSHAPEDAIEKLKPVFSRLLEDEDWLPEKYWSPAPESGMGGGIGQWLIFRSGSRDLSLFALVVPAGSETPVHDHLAWGLIGLYKGGQKETVFARKNENIPVGEREDLAVAFTRSVERGDFYPLLPPTDDIHRVETTSEEPSVSIHLLANDTGCVWRHAFDPETSEVKPFRSGYVNRGCEEAIS